MSIPSKRSKRKCLIHVPWKTCFQPILLYTWNSMSPQYYCFRFCFSFLSFMQTSLHVNSAQRYSTSCKQASMMLALPQGQVAKFPCLPIKCLIKCPNYAAKFECLNRIFTCGSNHFKWQLSYSNPEMYLNFNSFTFIVIKPNMNKSHFTRYQKQNIPISTRGGLQQHKQTKKISRTPKKWKGCAVIRCHNKIPSNTFFPTLMFIKCQHLKNMLIDSSNQFPF